MICFIRSKVETHFWETIIIVSQSRKHGYLSITYLICWNVPVMEVEFKQSTYHNIRHDQ